MTDSIDKGAYFALGLAFHAFQEEKDADRTVQDVVINKVQSIKQTFHTDFERDFKAVEFFKNKKIGELNEKERSTIRDIFSRLLRANPESSESSSPSTVSIEDPDAMELVEGALKKNHLTIESVKRDGLRYEEKMREYLGFPWAKGEIELEPVNSPLIEEPGQVSFMPQLLDVLEVDMNSLSVVEGVTAPNLFVADHLGTRKNVQMQLSLSTEENPRRISTTEEAIEYVTSVETFVNEISGEKGLPETKTALRNAILIYSSQQTANGFAAGYSANQTMIRGELGLEQFSGEPRFSNYRFEPVLDEEGGILPNQFKVTADVHMATFRTIRTEELKMDQEAFARAARLSEARETVGIGEVLGADIHGSFIVSVDAEQRVTTRDVEIRVSVVAPPVRDMVRAQKVINEVLDEPTKEIIKEESRVCEEAIRQELRFPPGATERRLPDLLVTSEMILPNEQDLLPFEAEAQSLPVEMADVQFTSNEKRAVGETAAKFFASDTVQRVVSAPYTNHVQMALGSIAEDTFKTHPIDLQSTFIPRGENQFQVTIRGTYVTEKEIEIDLSQGDEQRVKDAQRILGIGHVATTEIGASFIVQVEEGGISLRDLRTSYVATVGGALDEFVEVGEELEHAQTLIEESLEYDRVEKNKPNALTIEEIKLATTMYKKALQRELQISPGRRKVLHDIFPDGERLAPNEEMEGGAQASFYQDFEGDRKSTYREFAFPHKNSIRMAAEEDVSVFKENVAQFADQVGSSVDTKTRIENALLLFSTQHTENSISGPYMGSLAMSIAKVQGLGQLTTEPTKAEFSFEPIHGRKDQFKITLSAHYATWVNFERDPARADEPTFIEARELLGIGGVVGGDIRASFIVQVPATGPIVISNLKTTYSMQSL